MFQTFSLDKLETHNTSHVFLVHNQSTSFINAFGLVEFTSQDVVTNHHTNLCSNPQWNKRTFSFPQQIMRYFEQFHTHIKDIFKGLII